VLTRAEVAAMAAACGLALSDEDADLLTRRTEGWAAAVALAVLPARNDPAPTESLIAFRGADRMVADYVRDEIMTPLSRRATEFLTRSSILTRLSAPICDFVLERSDSGRVLGDLARTNLLVMPLDRTGSEFRCHSLLTDALRSDLRRDDPHQEVALHLRASAWYEQHGDPALAIEHARAAGDLDRAGALLWREAPSLIAYGHRDVCAARLARFSAQQVAAHPSLALTSALVEAAFGRRPQAEQWAATAQRLIDPAAADSATALRAIVAAVAATRTDEMHEQAARAHAAAAEDSPLRALACLVDGIGLDLSGDQAGARERLAEGERRGAAAAPVIQVLCLAQLALIAIDEDDWDAAQTAVAHSRAQMERVVLSDYPSCGLVFAVSAAVRGHYRQIELCQGDAREADRLLAAAAASPAWLSAECRIALARAALRVADVPRAHALLADAERDVKLLSPRTKLQRSIEACRRCADSVAATRDAGGVALTSAERRVLVFLPTHMSFREIADELVVSRNTVKTHVRSVYRKLLASGRSDAVSRARAAGLLDSPR
jgi:LuxR family maltose regulon positive regulatory protein